MSYREEDIVHENGSAWVLKERDSYTVFMSGVTHSTSDSSYVRDADGLSIAKARADYLERRANEKEAARTVSKAKGAEGASA